MDDDKIPEIVRIIKKGDYTQSHISTSTVEKSSIGVGHDKRVCKKVCFAKSPKVSKDRIIKKES